MAENESKPSAWGWVKKKTAGIDLDKMQDLYANTKRAYDAEMAGQWEQAYNLHSEGASLWTAYAKTAGSFSRMERVYKRLALKRAALHQERAEALRRFTSGGEPFPDTITMHPSIRLAELGLTEKVLYAQLSTADQHVAQTLALTLQETRTPQEAFTNSPPYTPTLPGGDPIEYRLERGMENSTGLKSHCTVTLAEAQTGITLLTLEAWADFGKNGNRIQEATVYRAEDYPIPAFKILPWIGQYCPINFAFPVKTTVLGIEGMGHALDIVPDRTGRQWGPRRLKYGGRLFVLKPLEPGPEKLTGMAVYEYKTTTPKPGSKTGKLDDDALGTKLIWYQSRKRLTSTWQLFCVPGLDLLFREFLIANIMAELAFRRCGASPPVSDDNKEEEEVAALKLVTKIGFHLISMAVGA